MYEYYYYYFSFQVTLTQILTGSEAIIYKAKTHMPVKKIEYATVIKKPLNIMWSGTSCLPVKR